MTLGSNSSYFNQQKSSIEHNHSFDDARKQKVPTTTSQMLNRISHLPGTYSASILPNVVVIDENKKRKLMQPASLQRS